MKAAIAAIEFALETGASMDFLRCWHAGDFDKIRKEWPDAPMEVYIGVDPGLKYTGKPQELNVLSSMQGYLRQCRSGGMTLKQSNLIEAAVANAQDLGYFKSED